MSDTSKMTVKVLGCSECEVLLCSSNTMIS